jgi:hypothetical protein
MAPNTNSDYVLEILEQVIAHTKQAIQYGWCYCRSSEEHEWIKEHTTQINCKVVERLNSVMRGEEQNYEEDVNNITRFKFIWMDNNIQDRNWFL